MSGIRRARRLVRFCNVGIAITALQACAINPLVHLDDMPRAANAEPHALDRGRDFSAAARQKYQSKMESQVASSAQLSSGLIGLGGIVAALAAGNAHRDVILGATLVGATAFSLGSWNLDKRRLLVYNGAIAGFNCADRAVTPLDASQAELKSLDDANKALARAVAKATEAVGTTELEVDKWVTGNPGSTPFAVPFTKAIAAAQQAIGAAATTQAAGEDLHYQASHASDRLIDAVRRIDQEANAALLDTLNDLNRVPNVIAGLAGIAGSIAPGSGVEAAISDALKNSVVVTTPAVKGEQQGLSGAPVPPDSLLSASNRMTSAVRELHAAASIVLGKVRPLGQAATANALADCGIGPVNFAMSTVPLKLSVPVGVAASYSVTINGGKAPYSVKLNGAAIPGVTVSGPDRLSASFEVNVAAAATKPQVANYLILDSSDPNRMLSFTVETAGPPATEAPPAATGPAAPASKAAVTTKKSGSVPGSPITAASPVLAAMQAARPFELASAKISYPSPPRQLPDGTFQVTIACNPRPVPPACLKQDDLLKAYLPNAGEAAAAAAGKIKFANFPPGKCAC